MAPNSRPDVDTNAINYANMSARGMLIRDARNNPKPSVEGKCFVDAFNPDTRKYMFDQLQQGYGKYGIDTFWLDASEPEGRCSTVQHDEHLECASICTLCEY